MPWSQGLEEGSPAFKIAASNGPSVRVLAGPGAGKSFAMKRRVARLLEDGVEPRSILPVTFTRVAAEDLHRELVGMDVDGCDRLRGTTLHSLALRTLMRQHVLLTTGRTPRPLNSFEMKPLEADLNAHGGLREVRKKVLAYEAAWARLQRDEPGFAQSAQDIAFANDLVQWLLFHEAMLIGEVIPKFYEYLRSNPNAPERTEFSHILVDEYQDLNKAEQSVIELLSGQANVCIVGDDDQSIYGFKHAHPEGIREWVGMHNAEDLTLDECRRCPTRVVAMANSLISHNRMRPIPRQLAPRHQNGEGDVRIVQYSTLEDEIEGVASAITEMVQAGIHPGDILVLAQRGVIGNPIFERLVAQEIPVRSYYAEAELDAEEAQRRFALLKLYVDRNDRVALRWLLGLGAGNWREPSYSSIRRRCAQENLTPWQVLSNLADGGDLIPHVGALVSRFRGIRDQLEELEGLPDLLAVINHIFPESLVGIGELRGIALRALEVIEEEDRAQFLAQLTSTITTPEVPTEVEEVRIMSLHKSKGLSAPVTIVVGCVEGLLPMRPRDDLSVQARVAYIEEQRRLFYVGITRVKASPADGQPGTLLLTYSQRMPLETARGAGISPAVVRYGTATLHASRFIAELGPSAPLPIAG
jgi:DNA helicase II / ATP-dependent DNA helicase PcrA